MADGNEDLHAALAVLGERIEARLEAVRQELLREVGGRLDALAHEVETRMGRSELEQRQIREILWTTRSKEIARLDNRIDQVALDVAFARKGGSDYPL